MRDSQKSKVYKAEGVFTSADTALPSVQDLEQFVKKVWGSKRVQKAWPYATNPKLWNLPRVHDGRGRSHAAGSWKGIWMPVWSRRTSIVLHELAHVIQSRQAWLRNGRHDRLGHDWEFCSIYLKLVLYLMGREAHDVLKASFKQHRVRFRPKAKRVMTPEARARLVERAALARAAKAKPKA